MKSKIVRISETHAGWPDTAQHLHVMAVAVTRKRNCGHATCVCAD